MIFGSVCSGIEAASVAWEPLGWRAAFVSEIEAFPRSVLTHRLGAEDARHTRSGSGPALWGDFTTIRPRHLRRLGVEPIDLLVGGTPCQSFSVAGLRGGLGDDRGNLALEYLRLAARLRPRWLVWENVPGVLSSNGGRDFGAILGGMVELGYGFAYRVLDAQYVRVDGLERAVPQRRRRVFVVGYLGDWRRAAAVLFERESLSGHPAPRRQAGQGAAPTLAARTRGGGGLGTDFDCDGGLILSHDPAVMLTARERKGALPEADLSTVVAHALRAEGFDASEDGTGRGTPLVPTYTLAVRGRGDSHNLEYRTDGTANAILTPNGGRAGIGVGAIAFGWQNSAAQGASASAEITPSLDKSKTPAVAFDLAQITSKTNRTKVSPDLPASTMNAAGQMHVAQPWAVRRLTPTECERLQGFPDGWTDVPHRGKPAADGPRYKALGNSMAVNVMRWIGRRIALVDSIREAA